MAEVASTAIAIISLGIQVCQGLVSYYQDFNSQDEKVTDILGDMDTLSNILEAIQRCLSKLNSRQLDTITQTQDCIIVCASAITKLDQLLAKCLQTTVPADFKEPMRVLTRKAMFPFCSSTIKDLRDTVKGLQMNVVIALQTLQLELSSHRLDDTSEVHAYTISTLADMTQVRNDVSGLSEKIYDIHSSLPELKESTRENALTIEEVLPSIEQSSAQTIADLARIDRSVLTLNQQIGSLGSCLKQSFCTLEHNIDCLPDILENKILTTLEVYFNRRVRSNASQSNSVDIKALQNAHSLQRDLLQKPSLLRSLCDRVALVEHSTNELSGPRDKRQTSEFGLSEISFPSMMLCSCKIGSTYGSRNWSTKYLSLFQSSAISFIHQKCCPLHIPPRKTTVIGMRYSYCGLLLSRLISVSVSITRGAGGSSISPNIIFRATVSRNSPAFALFNQDMIDRLTRKQTGSYYKWATQELYRLFSEQKASPSDVDRCGNTLLHAACDKSGLDENSDTPQNYRGLILSLRDWGVDYNETNIKGIRPLDAMLRFGVLSRNFEGLMDIGLELLDSGMEFSDSWWPEQNLVSKVHWGNYHRHLAMCLIRYRQVDEVVDGLQCGRLTRAILLRSEAKVSQIVEELPDCLRERNSVGHTPMHLAASWPAGISILLDAGGENLVNEPDNAGFLPLAYASYSKCLAAVRLLLDADCTLYTHEPVILDDFDLLEYTSDVIWDALTWSSEEVAKCIIQALADRRRRLAAIAFQELPCGLREVLALSPGKVIDANAAHVYSLLKENNILLPHSLLVPSWWQTIYHVLFRQEFWCSDTISKPIESPTKWADIFYNAGFHDFVEQDESRGNLLMMDFELFEVPCLAKVVNLILWFLRKGLSLELKMLRLNDDGKYIPHTPASLYVGRLIIHMLSKEPEALKDPITRKELVSLLKKVITERASDDCECSCSLDGCYAITAMMKESVRRYSEWDSQVHEFITWLVNLLDIANDGWSFIPANIIRFLTFERLELTHTCCVWQDGEPSYFAILDGDDRIEIQEEESADLSVLETLMEEFRHAFVYLGVPLTEFLQAYWMPRMEEVMGSPLAISEDEARQICELGVTWEPRKPRGILSPISSPREDGDMTLPRQTENLRKRQHSF